MSTTVESGSISAVGASMLAELAGRVLLAALYLISGLDKIQQYAETAAYMASAGVPEELLPAAISVEIFGALALIVGWKARYASILLMLFTFAATVIFHSNIGDEQHLLQLLKNVSIMGGLLLVAAHGPGPLSMDRRADLV